jgi:hypothetical protein
LAAGQHRPTRSILRPWAEEHHPEPKEITDQQGRRMPNGFHGSCEGPIGGLCLPQSVWNVLQRENITTFDQLKAVADQIEQVLGIEPKTALVVREDIARVAALADALSKGRPHNPWQAA